MTKCSGPYQQICTNLHDFVWPVHYQCLPTSPPPRFPGVIISDTSRLQDKIKHQSCVCQVQTKTITRGINSNLRTADLLDPLRFIVRNCSSFRPRLQNSIQFPPVLPDAMKNVILLFPGSQISPSLPPHLPTFLLSPEATRNT